MVKKLKGKDSFLFLAFGFLAISLAVYVYGETRINYLPRNQYLESVHADYTISPLTKNGISCGFDVFDLVATCNHCVQVLKPGCPDCCINGTSSTNPADRYLKCSIDDPLGCANSTVSFYHIYGYPNATTSTDEDCPCPVTKPVLPPKHKNKYPADMPLPPLECYRNTTQPIWYCDYYGYRAYTECLDQMTINLKQTIGCNFYNTHFYDGKDFYQDPIRKLDPIADADLFAEYSDLDPTKDWWEYEATPEFITCVQNCPVQTAKEVDCDIKQADCISAVCEHQACSPALCTPARTDGYAVYCGEDACRERDESPDCDPLATDDCATLTADATACLTGASGCDCFQEIDSTFKYEFMGRLGESVTFIWQIDTTSASTCSPPTNPPCPTNISQWPPYYFYTQIKVFDKNNLGGQPVWTSVMNQKQVATAFNIYSADQISNLIPGHKYVAKLFYFLPAPPTGLPVTQPSYVLSMRINRMSIEAIRIRE